jgi:integrase
MLTDITIRKLIANPPPERKETPDGKVAGLFFITQPTGAASWALRYRAAGAPRKLTLGCFPTLDLKAARRAADEARGRVARGEDPAGEKRATRAAQTAEREAETGLVEKVVETFVERHAKAHTRDWRETERLLKANVVKRWQGRRLSQISRADVHDLLDRIVDRGSPIAANRVLAQLRVMCAWAVKRGIIDRSPAEGVSAPSSEKGRARERVLDDREVRLVWKAAEAIAWPFGPIVQLLVLLGARRDEIAGMRRSELDLDRGVWTLPGERSKNRRPNEIPLPDLAVAILRSLPRVERSDFVFSATGKTPVSGFSSAKRQIDVAMAELAAREAETRGESVKTIEPWVIHDLRRTFATNLQKLGVRLEVTESILNHVSGSRAGVIGVYQRYSWADEKKQALTAWAARVEAIAEDAAPASNVVELASARA